VNVQHDFTTISNQPT